ncbi:MAG TPA: DUF1326 domain-containing protein [Ktedonobacterales bacterium]|nr:DUF1326 domain-containing protein [Ktedonobacterales bacterium]
MASSVGAQWRIVGDYFENCNCDVVCPCLVSTSAPMTSRPTTGACEVAFGFHVNSGQYGAVALDGLNAAMIARTPGPMADGNWSVALYVDERANEQQRAALQAIFLGENGGPISQLTPLVSNALGVRAVPITFSIEGKRRSIEIPGVMSMAVKPLPSLDPSHEIQAENAHPFAPAVALAVGDSNSTWADYGMRWDNSGKNGHYAGITWSNS